MFKHVAIRVSNPEEIKNFYRNLLGMDLINQRKLDLELSQKIFGKMTETQFFLLKKNDFYLEIFVDKAKVMTNYNHICIEVREREELIKKAKENGYPCTRIKRKKSDLIFIDDKSGNKFEIKVID